VHQGLPSLGGVAPRVADSVTPGAAPALSFGGLCNRFSGGAADQQTLDDTAARDAAAKEPRRKHPRVVHDDEVAGAQQLRQVRDRPVLDRTAAAVEAQQTGRAALRDRLLRDELGRQIEVEVADEHLDYSVLPITLTTELTEHTEKDTQ